MLENGILVNDKQSQSVIFTGYALLMIMLYFILLPFMQHLVVWAHTSQINSVMGLLLFCSIQLLKLKHMRLSRLDIGLRLKHGREEVLTTLAVTVAFCVFLLVVKVFVVHAVAALSPLPIFDVDVLPQSVAFNHATLRLIMALVYVMFCPLQVFLIHCAFQGPLMDIMPANMAKWGSIIMATALMVLIHYPINEMFAVAVILPSILWCYLYARYRSALLIVFSHVIIGLWALFFLGYQHIFTEILMH